MKKKMDVQKRVKLRTLKLIQRLKNSLEIVPPDFVASSEGCCGKKTFDSEVDALAYIKEHAISDKHNNRTRKPFRAYECSAGNWHLTSTPRKHYEQMLRKTGQK